MSSFKSRDFINEISVEDALYLELFDDIPYKWLIDKLSPSCPRTKRDEITFEVEITDCPVEKTVNGFIITSNDCATQFNFELIHKINSKITKRSNFSKVVTYDVNSPMDIFICENLVYKDEDEETP
jgi:hypothetical protein